MQAAAVYHFIDKQFSDLISEPLPQSSGRSYFLREIKGHRNPTNVVRFKEREDGTLKEVTLSVSARISGDAVLPLTSLENLASAIAREISLKVGSCGD